MLNSLSELLYNCVEHNSERDTAAQSTETSNYNPEGSVELSQSSPKDIKPLSKKVIDCRLCMIE